MFKKLEVFRNNFHVIKLVIGLSTSMATLAILSAMLVGISNVLTYTISFRVIIDSYEKSAKLPFVFSFVAFILIFDMVTYFINSLSTNVFMPKIRILVQEEIQSKLFDKSSKVTMSCLEDADYLDRFKFILQNSDAKVYEAFDTFTRVLTLTITSLGTMSLLFQTDAIGFFLIIGTIVLSFICQTKINIKQYNLEVEVNKLERQGSYFERVFYLAKYAKEIRINNLSKMLVNKYTKVNNSIKEVHRKSAVQIFLYMILKSFILDKFIVFSLYTALLLYKTIVLKTLTLGQFVGAYFAVDLLSGSLTFLLYTLPKFQKINLYIRKYLDFINDESFDEAKSSGTRQILGFDDLVFDNVSFRYNNEAEYSVKNISFRINKGEKVAFIGENGAGKSTIIKLILRLYSPTEGNILLNGIDIKEYDINSYRSIFATLFQDFQVYNASLCVNTIMDSYKDQDKKSIYESLKVSRFNQVMERKKINIFDELGKEFDEKGNLLSGGESQKLAISRMFYKNADFLILDEPSSALDVESGRILNSTLNEQYRDKTVLTITHKVYDLDNVDKIYLLENGTVKESGSKEQLFSVSEGFNKMLQSYKEI